MKGIYQAHNFSQRLEPEIETNIYRIVQEALNNIVKHSKASEFNVQITKHEEKIVVSVEDNGVGFDFGGIKKTDLKSGMGIINMQERIVPLDGNLSVNSKLGGGTEILIEIPLEEQNG
jgi:signal transduction histidine kinase